MIDFDFDSAVSERLKTRLTHLAHRTFLAERMPMTMARYSDATDVETRFQQGVIFHWRILVISVLWTVYCFLTLFEGNVFGLGYCHNLIPVEHFNIAITLRHGGVRMS